MARAYRRSQVGAPSARRTVGPVVVRPAWHAWMAAGCRWWPLIDLAGLALRMPSGGWNEMAAPRSGTKDPKEVAAC